jgi:hypothetical protein
MKRGNKGQLSGTYGQVEKETLSIQRIGNGKYRKKREAVLNKLPHSEERLASEGGTLTI